MGLELLSAFPITRQLCDPEGGYMRPHLSGAFPEQAARACVHVSPEACMETVLEEMTFVGPNLWRGRGWPGLTPWHCTDSGPAVLGRQAQQPRDSSASDTLSAQPG